ncbi:uncharacterized protein BCR38DRAFT_474929 [Pseudomassariella vexata]|uniref:Uncharacterized protein n=1 Tax=Pseudomassariella vexata TaxID=1141098 RepID=A0A1Y2DYZ0_9PEZI|nr:uncharacterized protein BCR38DRAFT_474929 [Pseudomassariella vexata]ORY64473.1 hypothetical protein BCR38DRAFT_474929 [Pseudomassariella vexata]
MSFQNVSKASAEVGRSGQLSRGRFTRNASAGLASRLSLTNGQSTSGQPTGGNSNLDVSECLSPISPLLPSVYSACSVPSSGVLTGLDSAVDLSPTTPTAVSGADSVETAAMTPTDKTISSAAKDTAARCVTNGTGAGINADRPSTPAMNINAAAANVNRGTTERSPRTPITIMVRNVPYDGDQIAVMGKTLAEARRDGDFPDTRSPVFDPEIIVHDYQLLQHLRELRGDPTVWPRPQEYNAAFVEVTRIIQQRDANIREEVRDANVHDRVNSFVHDENDRAEQYNLMRQAVAQALQQQRAPNGLQGVDGIALLNELRGAVANMAARGTHGVNAFNMEAVEEEVFGIIEAAMLDAAGPLRLNVNNMTGQVNAMTGQVNTLSQNVGAMNNHVSAMNNHVSAMNNHVSAMNNHVGSVGNYVAALGTFLNTINNNVNLTQNHMGQLTKQVNTLENVTENVTSVIPALVQQAIQQHLNAAIQDALGPALIAALPIAAGSSKGLIFDTPSVGISEKSDSKKTENRTKKAGFFTRLCGKFSRKDGRKDASCGSPTMAF